ncbi:SDR family oxidoreductase [Tautonia sociabilis]|uniref:SDR family oxidoreductase n=2 Tax=Tautonia sociabilis TaxID=2080755 RepID=A0A432MCK6_9BACT|nr:SDR family oxidoreductase [Tautonia sociabilis]
MIGKTCLVTGATSGIGAVTAEELARKGATVVLVGRDPTRCEAALARIRQRTGNPRVEALVADLSSQAEVRLLAEEFRRRFDRLDVLVNNAGALFLERRETVDGIERTFALNHLAYFLLTILLRDLLEASSPSRVVIVSSEAHRGMTLDFDDLEGRRRYQGMMAYGRSKLANLLFARELARRLEGTGVTVNALHPGFVNSSFFSGHGTGYWAMRRLAGVFAISPEQGARTSVYLASAPEVEGVSGRYFIKRTPAEPSRAAKDDEAARRLWRVSEERTGLASPSP